MDPRQILAHRVMFPLHAAREGSGLPVKLAALNRSEWLPPADIAALQLARLRALLAHAHAHSDHWRRVIDAAGVDPRAIGSLAELKRLPTMSKRDLQQHRVAMRCRVHPGRLLPDKTGGSTGEPVHFDLDSERFFWRKAVALRHDRWTGWEIGAPVAYVWGHRRDLATRASLATRLRQALLDRALMLDSSTLSERSMAGFAARLRKVRPMLWIGYANSLYLVTKFLSEGTGGDFPPPRAVISSAEYLEPTRRAFIEDALGCRVHDRYGSRETGLIASQCACGDGLHVAAESILVEVLDGDREAAPGTRGRIVVTDLLNFGLPFIRYEIADLGAWTGAACPCGRGLPLLRMEGGRVSDFIVTPAGEFVSGTALTIFLVANAPGVAQAQLVQSSRDHLTVRVVPGPDFGEATTAFFRREIPRFVGDRMTFDVAPVDAIPAAASGKLQFCISSVDPTATRP